MNFEQDFSIFTSIESYKGSVSNTGLIYISLDGEAFPSDEWTDFGFTIIPWWTEEVKNLTDNLSKTAKCEFMDGSYRFDINVLDSEFWEILFIKEFADSEKVLQKGKTHHKTPLKSLLKTTLLLFPQLKSSAPEKIQYWSERITWLEKATSQP